MDIALTIHRFQFAFTITFHYLFPQLTMGLALLILILKTTALRTGNERYNECARFWAKIFGVNFAIGVVTGIPMEFQFGSNWARFAKAAGGVIGQTLALEGVYAFFLESTFIGLFVFGEKRLGPKLHWLAAFGVFLGAWLSGYFIIATNAWMQHPVGYTLAPNGDILLSSFQALLANPWAFWQYCHNMTSSVATASFVMCALGAYYLLHGQHQDHARIFIRTGVAAGAVACVMLAFPTGDGQGRMIARYQPVTLAGMEGLFQSTDGAPMVFIGQPDPDSGKLDNPVMVPRLLSLLAAQSWSGRVRGLSEFPRDVWPDNLALLYYSYHIMAGLGTIFIAIMLVCAVQLFRKRLYGSKTLLWILMLAFPFPYIATVAGWTTVELGRQPWLIYGLMRTAAGTSPRVSAGNAMFSLLGFMGMYTMLAMLFLLLVWREIDHGPEAAPAVGYAE